MLVLVHEAGHFFTAKKFGIRVDEFGFGFPPRLFSIKKGETEYTFNLLPFGGFVKIFGENPDEENTNGPDRERSFVHKAKWKQALVLVAGVVANFLLAWLLFSIGLMSGLPSAVGSVPEKYLHDVNLVVVTVIDKSPADVAGLISGDKIVKIEGSAGTTTILTPETVKEVVIKSKGSEVDISYKRKNDPTIRIAKITPSLASGQPAIGISMDQIGTAKLPFFKALWEGLRLDWFVIKGTFSGLYNLIVGAIMGEGSFASVSGPVGMVHIVGEATKFGFSYLLSFAALISVNLGVINLLPFPALDGGRLFFLLIEKIKGSRIKPEIANTANMIGFGILIILMLAVTYHDIVKLF